MSTIKPTSVPSKRLAASITAASMAMQLNNIEGWDGNNLTSADFGSVAYAVLRNSDNSAMEIIEFDPSTIASASITILRRGLKFTGDLTTEVSANKLTWIRNDTIVELGTHVPQLLNTFMKLIGDETVAGVKTFSSSPVVPTPVSNTDAANKAYADAIANAGAADGNTTTKGIFEEATEAEIEAGTGAGATSARLAVNPTTLKSSDYGTKVYGRYGDYAADAGANDTYAITLAPVPSAYNTGMVVQFKPNTRNTGACTINVNSLGAKNIKIGGADPADGDLDTGYTYILMYDGTNFEVLNPKARTPAGSIQLWGTTTAPGGFVLCDGTAISRTTYAGLFAVIGTTFGVGDGSTTFNVPDLRGRTPIGVGTGTKVLTFSSRSSDTITVTGSANSATNEIQTGQAVLYTAASGAMTGLTHNTTYYLIRIAYNQFKLATSRTNAMAGTAITLSSNGTGTQTFTLTLDARTLADTGGEEVHSLTITEMPAHDHTTSVGNGAGGSNVTAATAGSTAGANVGSTGGSTAHNIMSPFLAINFIIKT